MKKLFLACAVLCCLLLSLSVAVAAETTAPALSDDLYSFQLVVNGELYTFPMTYADFTAKGWVYQDDAETMLDSGYYSPSETFKMGALRCYGVMINFDINAQPMDQCYVAGMSIDSDDVKKAEDFTLTLPGGLAFGTATAEDAEKLYGAATDTYEGSLYKKLTYTLESYRDVELEFAADTGLLSAVDMRNLETPADFVPSEVSPEVPAITTAYAAPDAIGDSLSSFTASYGGVVYQLPVPVSVMVANGWKIVESDSEPTVNGHNSGWVTLMMNNQRLRVLARNYSSNATAIANCFVMDFKSETDMGIELTVAKGITIGMSEADLQAALEGEDFKKDESTSYNRYYVTPTDSSLDSYEILTRDGSVYKMEVSYSPKYSEYNPQ